MECRDSWFALTYLTLVSMVLTLTFIYSPAEVRMAHKSFLCPAVSLEACSTSFKKGEACSYARHGRVNSHPSLALAAL
jgi:hypothetical protein